MMLETSRSPITHSDISGIATAHRIDKLPLETHQVLMSTDVGTKRFATVPDTVALGTDNGYTALRSSNFLAKMLELLHCDAVNAGGGHERQFAQKRLI